MIAAVVLHSWYDLFGLTNPFSNLCGLSWVKREKMTMETCATYMAVSSHGQISRNLLRLCVWTECCVQWIGKIFFPTVCYKVQPQTILITAPCCSDFMTISEVDVDSISSPSGPNLKASMKLLPLPGHLSPLVRAPSSLSRRSIMQLPRACKARAAKL